MNTNKSKHTPGPWRAEGFENLVVNAVTPEGTACTIIVAPGGSYMAGLAELKANAQLIAAAPELLEALRGLVNSFVHTKGNVKGNKAKTDMIKHNQPFVSKALNAANQAIINAAE